MKTAKNIWKAEISQKQQPASEACHSGDTKNTLQLKKTKRAKISGEKLSRLMRLSWEIQKQKLKSRSRALTAAWAILLNEDITVYYLIRKHGHAHRKDKIRPGQIALFP